MISNSNLQQPCILITYAPEFVCSKYLCRLLMARMLAYSTLVLISQKWLQHYTDPVLKNDQFDLLSNLIPPSRKAKVNHPLAIVYNAYFIISLKPSI